MIYALDGIAPEIDASAWVADTAVLIGKVTLESAPAKVTGAEVMGTVNSRAVRIGRIGPERMRSE